MSPFLRPPPAALAAVILAAALFGCGSPTGDPVGFEPVDRPVHKVIVRPADVDWRDTCYDVFVPTGRHYRLAAGGWAGYRSRILLRYDLSQIPKEVPLHDITSVDLKLTYQRVSGSLNDDIYSYGHVTLEAHALKRRFDQGRATWWRATTRDDWTTEGGDFGPTVARAEVGDPAYYRRYIRMDVTGLALDWISNPHQNFGLLLKVADEEAEPGIREFYSTDRQPPGKAPQLEIGYRDEDGNKAYRVVAPQRDCFITSYDDTFGGGDVHGYDPYLEFGSFNGYGRRALFYFDLRPESSGIPREASIARARLRLYYVPAGRDERVYVAVYRLMRLFDEGSKQDKLELQRYHDNFAYADREFKREQPGYVDLYVNTLVQEWVSGRQPNYGLVIKAPDEASAQVFPRFGSQENANEDRRPYLEVEYTLPAEPWFAKSP